MRRVKILFLALAAMLVISALGCSKTDDYILPDAQTHIYTKEELGGLSMEELRIARNKEWYQPSIEVDAFDDTVLSRFEMGKLFPF